jgi:hypothetical protein
MKTIGVARFRIEHLAISRLGLIEPSRLMQTHAIDEQGLQGRRVQFDAR